MSSNFASARRRHLHFESLEARHALASALVNVAGDAADANTEDGVCDVELGVAGNQCTLPAAAASLNANGGGELSFSIDGVFAPVTLTQAVDINGLDHVVRWTGTTQLLAGGSIRNLRVNGGVTEFHGDDATIEENVFAGEGLLVFGNRNTIQMNSFERGDIAVAMQRAALDIVGSDNVISANQIGVTDSSFHEHLFSGVRINGFTDMPASRNLIVNNTIGNDWGGIQVHGAQATFNRIEGNRIGTDETGTTARENLAGISIKGGAADTTIGGPSAAQQNIISGNLYGFILESPVPRTIIENNLIGLSATSEALGNVYTGILALNASGDRDDITIRNNTISANGGLAGIMALSSGIKILGNRIGTDPSGQFALPNAGHGVYLSPLFNGAGDNGDFNIVGGPGEGNIISGNGLSGIRINAGNYNVVTNNYIGLAADGMTAMGNNGEGIYVDGGGANNIIGPAGASEFGNVISGNAAAGVQLEVEADNNAISGNIIGLNASRSAVLPNAGPGVVIQSNNNLIGGAAPNAANVIAGNLGSGIELRGTAAGNHIHSNAIGFISTTGMILPNQHFGVLIRESATNNLVGDLSLAAGNSIRANLLGGVAIDGALTGNRILANSLAGNGGEGGIVHFSELAALPRRPVIRQILRTDNSITAVAQFIAPAGATARLEFFASKTDPGDSGQGELPVASVMVVVPASGIAQTEVTFPVPDSSYAHITASLTDNTNTTFRLSRSVSDAHLPTAFQSLVVSAEPNDILPTTLVAVLQSQGSSATGTVEFYDGDFRLGDAPVDANGMAALSVQIPRVGVRNIVAVYRGDTAFAGSISAPTPVTIELGPRPIANIDFPVVQEESAIEIDVTANDVAPSGAFLVPGSVTITRHPNFGFVSIDPTTGIVTYTPFGNVEGADFFRYTVADSRGAVSSPTQVTITILDLPEPYFNGFDVNADGEVSPIDALLAINQLNSSGVGPLAPPSGPVEFFYDTNGDNVLAPIDALLVINFLNANGAGQGQPLAAQRPNDLQSAVLTLSPRIEELGLDTGDLLWAWMFETDEKNRRASSMVSTAGL